MDSKDTAGEIWGIVLWGAQGVTYIMCAIRWFSTDHQAFWHGFKELVWALIPIVNFTYVWDWWFAFFGVIFLLIRMFMEWVKS